MAVAKSSWCWTACFRTNVATILPALMCATRRRAATRPALSPAARFSSSSGNSTRATGHRCASIPPPFLSRRRPTSRASTLQHYESAWELVLLERWAPGISIGVPIPAGIELLVLDGSFAEGGEEFTPLSWLRLPAGTTLQATAGRGGCKLWVKSGHLARGPRLPAAP